MPDRDLIAELAEGPPLAADRERDVTLLLRAAWLLAQHPDYVADTPTGRALRRVRIDLMAMAERVDTGR